MEIKVEDLTTMDLQGAGAFDNVMTAMQTRLDREYSKSRIKGPDYAKVYLGTFEASLTNSIQFILGRQEADKKADLLEAQTRKTDKETLLLDEQILIAKIDQDIKKKQLELAEVELDLKKQELLIREEELKIKQQELLIAIQKLELTKVQVWTEKAKVSDDATITSPPRVLSGLMGGQIRKIDNEGLLLAQKVITEEAQTKGSTTGNNPISGVTGQQMDLYAKQKDGFDRDAEQKLVKIYADAFNVQRGTDDAFSSCGTGLENMEIAEVLNIARAGIGAVPYSPPGNQIDPGSIWAKQVFQDGDGNKLSQGRKPTCPVETQLNAKNAIDLQEYERVHIAELAAAAKLTQP